MIALMRRRRGVIEAGAASNGRTRRDPSNWSTAVEHAKRYVRVAIVQMALTKIVWIGTP
jgi:hypothetical protein